MGALAEDKNGWPDVTSVELKAVLDVGGELVPRALLWWPLVHWGTEMGDIDNYF